MPHISETFCQEYRRTKYSGYFKLQKIILMGDVYKDKIERQAQNSKKGESNELS